MEQSANPKLFRHLDDRKINNKSRLQEKSKRVLLFSENENYRTSKITKNKEKTGLLVMLD